jgi:putative Mg2+ transporter-C (MgtC) family protein
LFRLPAITDLQKGTAMVWPHDFISIVLAVLLGAVIGLERELSGKAAGLRTNLLICLGASVFTIISRDMSAGAEGSVTRIAAQIVTGVGFLGAGAIIQDRRGVHGLTTAATIWLVASIGMACGAQFYILAVVSTLIAIVTLIGLGKLSKSLEQYVKKGKSQRNQDQLD